ncbi:hypothetical protein ABPG72_013027 [Tetrahymena utriculariae]
MAEDKEVKVPTGEEGEEQEREIVKIPKKVVQYCQICSLPPEYCMFQSNAKVRKCQEWLKINNPALFVKFYVEPELKAKEQEKQQQEGAPKEGEQPNEEKKEIEKPKAEEQKEQVELKDLTPEQLEKLGKIIIFIILVKRCGLIYFIIYQYLEIQKQKQNAKLMMQLSGGDNKITILTTRRKFKKFVTVVTGLSKYGVNLKEAAKRFRHKFACGAKEEGEEVEIQGEVDDVIADFICKEWKHITSNVFVYKKEGVPAKK